MDLSLETVSDVNIIVSYDDNQIVIRTPHGKESRVQAKDLILTPRQIITPRIIDFTYSPDIAFLFQLSPQIILFSSEKNKRIPSENAAQFLVKGIGIEQMQPGAAYRTFNLLSLERREVILIL